MESETSPLGYPDKGLVIPNTNERVAAVPPSRKRRRNPEYATRKRAALACQLCRLRKTKCDNAKPVCGFCRRHDARCVWDDGEAATAAAAGRQPDQVDLEILDRLDHLKRLLLENSRREPGPGGSSAPPVPSLVCTDDARGPGAPVSYSSWTCAESLLRWPIFEHIILPLDAAIESFALDEPPSDPPPPALASRTARGGQCRGGVQEEELESLCRQFLLVVHPRNPILDEVELIRYARQAAENGLGWDPPSCLVLLASALACFSAPWLCDASPHDGQANITANGDAHATAHARTYHGAAKKRFGFLGSQLVDIQCLFFASIFEKFVLNMVQSWLHLEQASLRFQICVKRTTKVDLPPQGLHQRVLWSLLKAEKELAPEFNFMQPTALGKLDHMQPLLSPPPGRLDGAFHHESLTASAEKQGDTRDGLGWYFYLAEISLRRAIDDTLCTLYGNGEAPWLSNVDVLAQQYAESERHMAQWYSYLQPYVRLTPELQPDSNEFSFYLQGRFDEWREYVLRPSLYCVLCHPEASAVTGRTIDCAQEAVRNYSRIIVHCSHSARHGGTWFACRRSFTGALLILAVTIRDHAQLKPPDDWHALVDSALGTLRRWEQDAPDVRGMRETLERILASVNIHLGS